MRLPLGQASALGAVRSALAPHRPRAPALPSAPPAERTGPRRRASPLALLLGTILSGALGLRLWSIGHGLPHSYNVDEDSHFVEIAIGVAEGDLNPHYFENPPALTYLLAAIFRVGVPYGRTLLAQRFLDDPGPAFLTGRLVVVLLAVLTVAVVYWAGRRWFDRRAGLVAATLLACAFLPVFYAKQAVNDTVTMLPLAIGLVACLDAWERGRARDWLLAGAAFGVATATKYTAGAALVMVVLAAAYRLRRDGPATAARNLALTAAVFAVTYLALNPYTLLDYDLFARRVLNQASMAARDAKLGHDQIPATLYYLRTLTWGLGWAPLAAAAVGAAMLLRAELRRGLLLLAFPVVLFCFLSLQERFFARWLLLAYPSLVLCAGYAVTSLAGKWLPARAGKAAVVAFTALLALQGLLASAHVSQVLGRTDTRELAADWLVANLPPGTRIVLEPFTPEGYLKEKRTGPGRFAHRPVARPYELYETTLTPSLVDQYRRGGWCWVVVGSHQKDRGLKAGLPGARAYYERLRLETGRIVTFSPYRAGMAAVPFDYDLSYNYLPRAYERPGPVVEIYQLAGCQQRLPEGAP